MGTNYYAKPREDHFNLAGEGLHIGKSSAGLEFLWRAHPDSFLTTSALWCEVLAHPAVVIVSEYGVELTFNEFCSVAFRQDDELRRQHSVKITDEAHPWWRDGVGCSFAAYEFS